MGTTQKAIKQTYEEAMKIAQLQPWSVIPETEVFAIEHPESHVLYFVQVLGHSQPIYGLQISKGYEAYLRLLQWLKDGDSAVKANRLALYNLYFNQEPLEEIETQRLQIAEITKPTLFGWPRFKDFTPEFLPWQPEEEEFSILEILLPQIRNLLQMGSQDPTLLFSDEGCLIRRFQENLWQNEIQNIMPEEREKLSYSRPEEPDPLRQLPQNPHTAFEAVLELSDVPFQTKAGERPFYPWIFLLVDAADGQLLDYRLTSRKEHFASVSEGIVEALRKTGYRPGEILIDTAFPQVLLSGVCQEVDISVRKDRLEYAPQLLKLVQKKLTASQTE